MRLEHESRIENRVGYPDSHNSLDANKAVGGVANIPSDEEKLTVLYNELERIDSVLSNPDTTKEQALKELESYNFLIKNNENVKLLNSAGNEIAEKSRAISNKIQDYFIMKDMVTFGYFIEKMDITSKYAYDISVKYQREGMNKYVDFYKDVTKKINTFGDYIGDSTNEGKQTKVRNFKFNAMLYEHVEPYLYYGNGKGHILYENNIKIVKVGNDKFNILIDGKLV